MVDFQLTLLFHVFKELLCCKGLKNEAEETAKQFIGPAKEAQKIRENENGCKKSRTELPVKRNQEWNNRMILSVTFLPINLHFQIQEFSSKLATISTVICMRFSLHFYTKSQ